MHLVIGTQLAGANAQAVAHGLRQRQSDGGLVGDAQLIIAPAIHRAVDHILRLAESCRPGEHHLIALHLRLDIGGQVGPDLIVYINVACAVAMVVINVHIVGKLVGIEADGSRTDLHIVAVGRVVIIVGIGIIHAAVHGFLDQLRAVRRIGRGGRGVLPTVVGVGRGAQLDGHILHIDPDMAAGGADGLARLVEFIVMAAGTGVVHPLGGAGGGSIVHIAAEDAGGSGFRLGHLFTDAGVGMVVADLRTDGHPAALQRAAEHVVLVAVGIQDVAGEGLIGPVANGAHSLLGRSIQLVGVAVLKAVGLQRVGVNGFILAHVVDVDGQLVGVGMSGEIDGIEVQRSHGKDLVIVKYVSGGDAVGLFAAAAADVVQDAVVVIPLAAAQRIGAGQGVIVAGEHHIDAGLLRSGGHQGIDLSVTAGIVGVIGGLVHGQDLPVSGAGLGILLQPIQRGAQLRSVAGVVDDGQIHVAVGAGVAASAVAGIQAEHGLGLQRLALQLMVAQDLHHVGTAHGAAVKEAGVLVPALIGAGVIHCVTGLDTEVPVAALEGVADGSDIGQVIGLDITQDEEVGMVRLPVGGGEGGHIRPQLAAAHLIVIGGAGGQAGEGDVAEVRGDIAALGEGHLGGIGRDGHPIIAAGDGIADALLALHSGVAEPTDVLLRGFILGCVEADVIGQGLAGNVIHADAVTEGEQARLVLGIHQVLAHGLAEAVRGQLAVLVGDAHQLIGTVHVDGHAHGGLALGIHHGQSARSGLTDDDGCRGNGILRAHGDAHLRLVIGSVSAGGGEEAAALDGEAKSGALVQRGGDLHPDGGHEAAVIAGGRLRAVLQSGLHRQLFAELAEGIGTLVAVGKDHLIIGEEVIQLQDGGVLRHGGIRGQDLNIHGLAEDGRLFQGGHLHGGGRRSLLHGEGAGLGGLVAEAVAQGHGDCVLAVLQLQVIQMAHGAVRLHGILIPVIVHHVHIVDVHADGILVDAGGVLVLHIVEDGVDLQLGVLDDGVILQLRTVDGDGVHHGSVRVVHIGAIHELEVIKIDGAGGLGAHIGAGHIHQPEGHAGLDAVGRGELGQIGLHILPTLPIDAGLHAVPGAVLLHAGLGLQCEVIGHIVAGAVLDVAAQPEAGLGADGGIIGDAHALGGIDPGADGGGGTADLHACRCTDAGALGHGAAVSEVIIQLQGLGAEADGLVIVDADDLDGLLAAAAIVPGGQDAAVTHIIIRSGGHGAGLGVHMVLKVPHNGGQHAHDGVNGALDRLVPLGDGVHVAVEGLAVGGGEAVAVKGAHILRRGGLAGRGLHIGDAPEDVAGLDMDVAALAADHQTEVRGLLKAQADLLVGEIDLVGGGHLDGGGADDLAVQQHIHAQGAAGLVGGQKAGGGIHGAHVLAALRQGIADALRQSHRLAGGINAHSGELHLGAGGIDLVIGAEHSVVEDARGLGGGDHQQAGADLALGAVSGGIAHLQLVRALGPGAEGGGAAAVQRQSGHTAAPLHHLGQLIICTAIGNGCPAAIGDESHDGTVGLDAHSRAAVADVAILAGADNDLAVLHQDGIAAHGGLQVAQVGRVAHNGLAVLGDAEVGPAIGGVIFRSVHDQGAHGLAGGHVEEVGVDARDNGLAGMVFLISLGLHRGGGQAPFAGIVMAIAADDLQRIPGLDLRDVIDLLAVAGGDVADDLAGGHAVGDMGDGVLDQDFPVRYTGPAGLFACLCKGQIYRQQ